MLELNAKEVYVEYARIGKAISSPIRIELLDLLGQSEKTVEVLAEEIQSSVANVSKHLQVLRQAKLVSSYKEKNFVYYQLASEHVQTFLRQLEEVSDKQLIEVKQLKEQFLNEPNTLTKVYFNELDQKLASGEITLIDVRPAEEFEYGHIDGAVSIPVQELEEWLTKIPKNREVVAYCRGPHCIMSLEALEILTTHGFHAKRLAYGVTEWEEYKQQKGAI